MGYDKVVSNETVGGFVPELVARSPAEILCERSDSECSMLAARGMQSLEQRLVS